MFTLWLQTRWAKLVLLRSLLFLFRASVVPLLLCLEMRVPAIRWGEGTWETWWWNRLRRWKSSARWPQAASAAPPLTTSPQNLQMHSGHPHLHSAFRRIPHCGGGESEDPEIRDWLIGRGLLWGCRKSLVRQENRNSCSQVSLNFLFNLRTKLKPAACQFFGETTTERDVCVCGKKCRIWNEGRGWAPTLPNSNYDDWPWKLVDYMPKSPRRHGRQVHVQQSTNTQKMGYQLALAQQ